MKDTINFNKVYIIQSLFENDKKTGTNLYNDLLRWHEYQLKPFSSELIDVYDKKSFKESLDLIKRNIEQEKQIPYIHFEIHGNREGFVISSNENISWNELADKLREINILIKNNLFISLATCYGAYIFNALTPFDKVPFYAYIGPDGEIFENDIEVCFNSYFEILLREFDFRPALEALNKENNNKDVFYDYKSSEDIFELIANRLIEKIKNGEKSDGEKDIYIKEILKLKRDVLMEE